MRGCLRFFCIVFYCLLFHLPAIGQLDNGWHNPFDKSVWYKRYTGSIGGSQVTVNLVLWDYFIAGNFNFNDKSDMAEICTYKKDELQNGGLLVYGFADNAEFSDTAGSKSIIYFKGDSITGKWEDAHNQKVARISLKEKYTEGSYPFDLGIHKDSVLVNNNLAGLYMTYKYVMPGAKMKKPDAEWFESAMVEVMGTNNTGARTLTDYMRINDSIEFAGYRKLMDDSLSSAENFYLTQVIEPWYNNHGIVVLKVDYYVAIPNVSTRESYYCLDVLHKKVLHLNDIMNVQPDKLKALLEDDMKAYYAPMHPDFKGPYAAISNDIYVSDYGITFLFGNNDFVNTPCFFLPYSKVKDMLKPEFKKRMKL